MKKTTSSSTISTSLAIVFAFALAMLGYVAYNNNRSVSTINIIQPPAASVAPALTTKEDFNKTLSELDSIKVDQIDSDLGDLAKEVSSF